MSGQTIEVLNTDAEGRLVLADALLVLPGPLQAARLMVDLATLTGAIIVALGNEYAGLFANNDELAERLIAAGKAVGEQLWRMPLGRGLRQADRFSDAADVKNIGGGRGAGSTIGAQFLQRFVNDVPLGASRHRRRRLGEQGRADRAEGRHRLRRAAARPPGRRALREGVSRPRAALARDRLLPPAARRSNAPCRGCSSRCWARGHRIVVRAGSPSGSSTRRRAVDL